jgi:hypothetical protein
LVETLLSTRCAGGTRPDPARTRDAVQFVSAEHSRLPRYLRPALACATMGLSVWALVRSGAPFSSLPVERRRALVEVWRRSRFGPCGDLVRFYEGLSVYAWHSRTRASRP